MIDGFYNLQLEQAALACILINPETLAEMGLKFTDFHDHRHQIIFTAIERLDKSRLDIDILTVSHELEKLGRLKEIGGDPYLITLVNSTGSSLSARSYADQLKELTMRRKLTRACGEIVNLANDPQKSPATITSEARQFLDDALNASTHQSGRSMAEALKEFDQAIESRKGQDFSLLGISTGYQDIDHKLDGLQDGWLYLVAARPGNGKTAMLGNLALNVAKQGKQVLFFSVEMNDLRIVSRMMAAETQINADILKHAGMEDAEEWERYYTAIETFEGLPMWLYSPAECRTVEQIESITRQRHANSEVDIIFVDYLQLLQLEATSKTATREQEVTKIAQTLKRITNLNIPVVAAAQLNREVVGRPQLSNLRESGSLEQEADAVCFLHHPDDEPDANLEFIVAKNRDGALGECLLYYGKTTQKIHPGAVRVFAPNQPRT
ncbi:hypothetical protein FBQ81_05540 [Chloroflexi bacterium CFX6]|nr:hypothetical protein [Chloroflexi bacterium CFX6]